MAKDPNILEQIAKGTGEFVNKNITGSLSGLTDEASKKIASATGLDENTTRSALPWAAGGLATLAGIFLLQPIHWATKKIFGLAKNIVTGFGLLEKIPIIGGLFSMLGKAIDTIGEYAGYIVPAIAGFIGYKAFQTETKKTPPGPGDIIARLPEDTQPAIAGALPGLAIGAQAGMQTRGQRAEVIKAVIAAPVAGEAPATSTQVTRLRELLGEDGFAKLHKSMFGNDPTDGKVDARLTGKNAGRLIYQIEGLETDFTRERIGEIRADKPKMGIGRTLINRTPVVGRVVEWISPATGLTRKERISTSRQEAQSPAERSVIRERIVSQLVEEVHTVRGTTATLAPAAAPAASTPAQAPVTDTPEPSTGRTSVLDTGRDRIGFGASRAQAEMPGAQARATPASPFTQPPPTLTGEPVLVQPPVAPAETPHTPQNTNAERSFWSGAPRPGFTYAAGGAAALGGAAVLMDKNASTAAKVAGGTAAGSGVVATAAQLAGYSRAARNFGIVGAVVTAPLTGLSAIHSFTKENKTAEDYVEGGINTAYTVGVANLWNPVGLPTLVGAGVADIGHKGYQIVDGLSAVERLKTQIDASYTPSKNAMGAAATIQGVLKEKLKERGVPMGRMPGGEWVDIRSEKDAYIAKKTLEEARDAAKARMDAHNHSLIPRFLKPQIFGWTISDSLNRDQDIFEQSRDDYKRYERALSEFDNFVEGERKAWPERELKMSEVSLGELVSNNALPTAVIPTRTPATPAPTKS